MRQHVAKIEIAGYFDKETFDDESFQSIKLFKVEAVDSVAGMKGGQVGFSETWREDGKVFRQVGNLFAGHVNGLLFYECNTCSLARN